VKRVVFVVGGLVLLAGLAEVIILAQVSLDPGRLAAALVSLALTLGAFVGLTQTSAVRQLRHWASYSSLRAIGMPLLLLIPYLVFALGTRTFSPEAFGGLTAYVLVPTVLLLPERSRRGAGIGWRDVAAMLALALPVSAGWLRQVWTWPFPLYFFQPLFCVCVGAYGFLVLRNLEGVGYRLIFRKGDLWDGTTNFLAFALLGIPLGLLLGFIHPHTQEITAAEFATQFFGIYLTIAIPEELLFRGILQNLLAKSIAGGRGSLYGLLIASVVFGAAHLHHAPAPNWKYAVMASLAGVFYGNAYRTRQRLSAPALTHTLVDTAWHFWF